MKLKLLIITLIVTLALRAFGEQWDKSAIDKEFLGKLAEDASLPKSESEVRKNADAKAVMPEGNAHKATYENAARDKRSEQLRKEDSLVSRAASASEAALRFKSEHEKEVEQTDLSAITNSLNADKANSEMAAAQRQESAKEKQSVGFNGENLSGVIVPLFIAEEIHKDADKNLDSLNAASAKCASLSPANCASLGQGSYQNFSVFAGREESCYKPAKYDPSLKNECGMTARVVMKYICDDDNGKNKYVSYDSCKAACSKVCREYRDYSDPKLEIAGQDVTKVLGVSESAKNLAKGKAFDSCSGKIRTETDNPCKLHDWRGKCLYRETKGWRYYYCCYDSPTSKELARVLKEQLALPQNSCSGIPFASLERVNWDTPEVRGVMETQMTNIFNSDMRKDLAEKAAKGAADINTGQHPPASQTIPKI